MHGDASGMTRTWRRVGVDKCPGACLRGSLFELPGSARFSSFQLPGRRLQLRMALPHFLGGRRGASSRLCLPGFVIRFSDH